VSEPISVAVVGATGLVGETLLAVLAEREFPLVGLEALDSERSLGGRLEFRGRHLRVGDLGQFDFSRVQLAFFAADADIASTFVPRAVDAGCVVIDMSTQFRDEPDVPLVVPEVNPDAIAQYAERRLIASPGSSAIQLALVLKPLQDAGGIERVQVATYEAVSGAGREALEELATQSAALLSGRGAVPAHVLPRPIAFNCVPQVGTLLESGHTRDELAVQRALRRLLDDQSLSVNVTAVQVPVFFGHSQAAHLDTRERITAEVARTLLQKAPGVTVLDEHRSGGYPTAAIEAANRDTVYVGRIREDMSYGRGLNLWIVADNVRKGAATNAVQIAEILVRDHL
jgi:aspartate-semialdehyde dehydrogenase